MEKLKLEFYSLKFFKNDINIKNYSKKLRTISIQLYSMLRTKNFEYYYRNIASDANIVRQFK
jgi:hypothetical protein